MATNWPSSVQTFSTVSPGGSLNSPSHSGLHNDVSDTVEALQEYAGLVLVKSQTVGSGVSSVTINNVFDSRFDVYKIVYSNIATNTSGGINIQLTSSGTASTANYYWATVYVTYSTSAVTGVGGGSPRSDYPTSANNSGGGRQSAEVTVFDPFIAHKTSFSSTMYINRTDIGGVGAGGMHNVIASYDGIKVLGSGVTMTGGTILVYGYNNG